MCTLRCISWRTFDGFCLQSLIRTSWIQVRTLRYTGWRGLRLQCLQTGWGRPLASGCGALWMHGSTAAALTSDCKGSLQ